MTVMPSAMRGLAQRLLAVETASQNAAGSHVNVGVRVCEKLQMSVSRFAGSDAAAHVAEVGSISLCRCHIGSIIAIDVGLSTARGPRQRVIFTE